MIKNEFFIWSIGLVIICLIVLMFSSDKYSYIIKRYWLPGGVSYEAAASDFTGTFKRYFRTGELMDEGDYNRGIKRGYHKGFYKNGSRCYIEFYNLEGKKDFVSHYYYTNGKKCCEIEYSNGILNGKSKYYGLLPNARLMGDWPRYLLLDGVNVFEYLEGKVVSKYYEAPFDNHIGTEESDSGIEMIKLVYPELVQRMVNLKAAPAK